MNDPGLDQPISRNAKAVEEHASSSEGEDADEVEDEQAYLKPSRWWFASTAFPLIAGTFGPMASAFNVCAIASHWRMTIQPDQIASDPGEDIPDPSWLLAINGVSLAIAIIANLALLFNMARRIPFSIAQPVTIIGWYMSGCILIGLVSSIHAPSLTLPPSDNVVLTQAYYYACLAAALYILVASAMVVTVVGAYRGHYSKDFQLTMSQRTLMLQTIAYLVYLLGGGAIYARIEGWPFLIGVWFANFTLLTIGIGDYYPQTMTGQGLLFPFAIGGIVILGLVVGSIRSLVLERGEKKIAARIVEKKREKVVRHIVGNDNSKVRLGLFAHHHVNVESNEKKEWQRRAEEFKLMRRIQRYADDRKKWTALSISAVSWIGLWLIGAAAFYACEQDVQPELDYFEWVYFAYTSLLTIGYGDLTINGNAGKPIFVFWSLLAVPTLTILISNMGDTVVKVIRDVTDWFGQLTILPGEGSTRHKLKKGTVAVTRAKVRKHVKHKDDPVEEPPGGIFLSEAARRGDDEEAKTTGVESATDRLTKEFEDEELDAATIAKQKGDQLSSNVHLYHYLLIREIRNVMKDINEDPPKKYSYHEWAWFMRLLGEDENDAKFHKKPVDIPGHGQGKEDIQSSKNNDASPGGNPKSSAWSWVGINSPLLGTQDEAEWVLERLSQKMEDELKEEGLRAKDGRQAQQPPVTEGSREQEQASEAIETLDEKTD